MSKILAVFGSTGQQGGSVIDFVLKDPELSKEYKIRAVTRDPASEKAKDLEKRGAEVVKADADDEASLPSAVKGAHTVFAMTSSSFDPNWKGSELAQGKAIADAAVAANVQYLIFSTLPHVKNISGGKYTKVFGFDFKAEVEEYIRQLPIKSAFFSPGSFMQNWHQIMKPRADEKGEYPIERHISPQAQLPLIDITADTGKFIGAILAKPDQYEGKVFCAATKLYTMEQMAQIVAKHTGKKVYYRQISTEEYHSRVAFMGPFADLLTEMMLYQQDFGYYGPDTEELVKWAVDNARGKLSTFEEYFEANPLKLD